MNHKSNMSEIDMQKVSLILQFLQITKDGMTKPYDPTPFLKKLNYLKDEGVDISGLEVCCPTSAEVKDAKDFKPYIEASLKEYARLMELEVRPNRNYDRY